jgi:hypothetical protein
MTRLEIIYDAVALAMLGAIWTVAWIELPVGMLP